MWRVQAITVVPCHPMLDELHLTEGIRAHLVSDLEDMAFFAYVLKKMCIRNREMRNNTILVGKSRTIGKENETHRWLERANMQFAPIMVIRISSPQLCSPRPSLIHSMPILTSQVQSEVILGFPTTQPSGWPLIYPSTRLQLYVRIINMKEGRSSQHGLVWQESAFPRIRYMDPSVPGKKNFFFRVV